MNVAAIVLAAGASHRLGRPKQNVVLAGETLLERTTRIVRDAELCPIIVIVRNEDEHADLVSSPDLIVAVNQNANEGIASSIRCGVAEASRHAIAGAVILTCDQPALCPNHLRALIEDAHRITCSAYGDSVGVPAYFPVEFLPSLLQLRGDTGARGLLKTAHAIAAEELKLDIDTEHDLNTARNLFENRQS
jgi:molybdenum cofactor cytidylyltransferase